MILLTNTNQIFILQCLLVPRKQSPIDFHLGTCLGVLNRRYAHALPPSKTQDTALICRVVCLLLLCICYFKYYRILYPCVFSCIVYQSLLQYIPYFVKFKKLNLNVFDRAKTDMLFIKLIESLKSQFRQNILSRYFRFMGKPRSKTCMKKIIN